MNTDITFSCTYSPDDNKLRLTASARLDADTYARIKAAGFSWAPKLEQFVAPMWTPSRADLALELAGEISDDDTTLMDRAEDRAERFTPECGGDALRAAYRAAASHLRALESVRGVERAAMMARIDAAAKRYFAAAPALRLEPVTA
jgi:hypothetical protein